MIEKQLFGAILSRIKVGALKVTYWDGSTITYGNAKPDVHITFKNVQAARAILKNMSLGFGEGYMNGDIEIKGPLDHVGKIISENQKAFSRLMISRLTSIKVPNTRSRQKAQIQHHYDLGNQFYKLWLDRSMTYSCAYFKKDTDSLEVAQDQKRQHLLRKLQLKPGMTLLDIGSGWGELLFTAAKDYGITGMGVTLSAEQYKHCIDKANKLGLDDKIKFELINYQDLAERKNVQFDRVISVGMFEHVGKRNQSQYFGAVDKLLKLGGISVLHTIFVARDPGNDPWIDKYVFPGGYLPELAEISRSMAERDMHMVDLESLRLHYAMTLDEWWKRYETHKADVIKMYDKRFYRMWRFWLQMSSAGFRYGNLDLGQIVFTKGINNALPLTREHWYK